MRRVGRVVQDDQLRGLGGPLGHREQCSGAESLEVLALEHLALESGRLVGELGRPGGQRSRGEIVGWRVGEVARGRHRAREPARAAELRGRDDHRVHPQLGQLGLGRRGLVAVEPVGTVADPGHECRHTRDTGVVRGEGHRPRLDGPQARPGRAAGLTPGVDAAVTDPHDHQARRADEPAGVDDADLTGLTGDLAVGDAGADEPFEGQIGRGRRPGRDGRLGDEHDDRVGADRQGVGRLLEGRLHRAPIWLARTAARRTRRILPAPPAGCRSHRAPDRSCVSRWRPTHRPTSPFLQEA